MRAPFIKFHVEIFYLTRRHEKSQAAAWLGLLAASGQAKITAART